ncbi:phage tail family protein [Streptomyces sp. ActVer]|uniref:phage distal tail protein n=1 Tax=Streptomyces sp. ActVer TaxID=3014558 RepID=UPI0022B4EC9D|nr:phage tail domain-containing protein [Streptomyces sp. ActVer]MCZ4506930.1 phage tail family protein [Streptomyces sp. ActVer]
MPILVPPTDITPEPPTGPPWPTLINQMPAVAFTDPYGAVTMLSDWENGWLLQPGAKGLDMPSYQFTTDESPGIDGYELRDVRAQGKEIVLPLAFWMHDSRAAYLARRRSFIRSLNPKRGVGTLTLTQPDGAARSIRAYYAGGLEGDESRDAAGERWCINAITFGCPSPYWIGAEVSQEWRAAAGGTFFPILPLVVGDSQVLGEVTVDNDGDDVAYPVWTITGPATSVSLTNTITDPLSGDTIVKELVLTHTIVGGDVIVIDTRERRQTAVLNGVTNLWPDLSDDSELWPLEAGINHLDLTVAGSTSATSVRMTYQPRYLAS